MGSDLLRPASTLSVVGTQTSIGPPAQLKCAWIPLCVLCPLENRKGAGEASVLDSSLQRNDSCIVLAFSSFLFFFFSFSFNGLMGIFFFLGEKK